MIIIIGGGGGVSGNNQHMSASHPAPTWKDTEGGASLMSWKQPGEQDVHISLGRSALQEIKSQEQSAAESLEISSNNVFIIFLIELKSI